MAKKQTYTLDAGMIAALRELIRRILRESFSTAITPYNKGVEQPWVKWVKITGSTLIAPNRYSYSWIEQSLKRAGVWQDKEGGLDNTKPGMGVAYNTIEAFNSDTGEQGNSVDLDSTSGDFALVPVGLNPVVLLYRVINCDGDPEFVFVYENATTNNCPTG